MEPRKWTDAKCKEFGEAIDFDLDTCKRKLNKLPGDTWLDDLTQGCIQLLKKDRESQTHEGVKACLEGAISHLEEAGFAHYASYK